MRVAFTSSPSTLKTLFKDALSERTVLWKIEDIDFDDDRREEVINYIGERYGEDRVTEVITFDRYKLKSSVRNLGRIFGLKPTEQDAVADKIEQVEEEEGADTMEEALDVSPDLRNRREEDERFDRICERADDLQGLARHPGRHPAAVIVTPGEMTDYVPTRTMKSGGEDHTVTHFDGDQLEDIGLLKIDVLGLAALNEIDTALEMARDLGHDITEEDLDGRDDPAVYENIFAEGDTRGIFQFESGGMRQFLAEMEPTEFVHIAAMNALYRPGPMEQIPSFIDRMHGEEETIYIDRSIHDQIKEDVADVLDDTYGIMVFQEQVMQVCRRLAGFDLGEADIMRRCVPGDTEVVDAETGERKRIDSIEPGTSVLTMNDEYELAETTVAKRFENGTKPTFRVTTRSGRTIEMTKDHPLRTIGGWEHLSDLSEGDPIAVPSSLPASGTESPPDERMRVVASLIGDGQTLRGNGRATARFYSSDPDLLDSYCDAVSKLGGNTTSYDHPTTDVKTVTARGPTEGQNPIINLVRETGIDEKAADKRLPEEVFRYDAESLARFLAYLFDTDGGFEETRVSYSSASEGLIEDVAHALLRLGIVTMRFHREMSDHQDNFELIIGDQEDIVRFADVVGPHLCPRRKKALKPLKADALAKSRSHSMYNLPAEITHKVQEAKYASGRTWKEGGEIVGRKGRNLSSGLNFTNPNQKLSRHRTEELGRAFNSDELVNIADGEVLWDPIVDITPVGEKKVYDLAVPPHRNFVASDIVIHNSIGKKKEKLLMEQKQKFVQGCIDQGYGRELGETIFQKIEEFADYAFNRAHSSSYAALAYKQAYLKHYCPAAFYAAAVQAEGDDDKRAALIRDLSERGVEVKRPSINESKANFAATSDNVVRFGLSTIKNVGKQAGVFLEEREKGGPFESFMECLCRCTPNARAVKSLIKAGAFDDFDLSRATMMENHDKVLTYARKRRDYRQGSRKSMPDAPSIHEVSAFPRKSRFRQEREVAVTYTTGAPTDDVEWLARHLSGHEHTHRGTKYRLELATILEVRDATTSTGNRMWWVTYRTAGGKVPDSAAMWDSTYEAISEHLEPDTPAVLVLETDVAGDYAGSYTVENAVPARQIPARLGQVACVETDSPEAARSALERLSQLPEGEMRA